MCRLLAVQGLEPAEEVGEHQPGWSVMVIV
jgi:hypothetical protein